MEIYRVPRRDLAVRILLDDGRTLDGRMFTADSGPGGRPEDALHHLNDGGEEFVPLACGEDSFLLNKAGIIWAQLSGEAAREIAADFEGGRTVPVRLTLAAGISLVGTFSVLMPAERNRVLDYLNASERFLPLFGDGMVTLVQRGFVVTVRNAEASDRS